MESNDTSPRICGVGDHLGQGDNCRWPDGDISWTITAVIPGFTADAMQAAAATAFARLAAVCGITPRHTDTARTARILLGTHSFDGSGGILADSMLPCGNVTQCRQRYDTGEKWTIDDGKAAGRIDLVRVMAHEIMHALGVGHLQAGSPNLIAPTYSQTIIGPQAGDIAELRRRYGPPQTQPTNPTPTTPTGGSFMGGLKGLLDLINKIGPLLDLFNDPAFAKLLETLVKLFGNKQTLTADDLEALKIALEDEVQQMRA